jgi:hypothetical protein
MIQLEVGEIVTGMERLSLPRYTLSDDGNFLRLRWTPGITIEADDIRSSIAAVTSASPEASGRYWYISGGWSESPRKPSSCSLMTPAPLAPLS